ncbi:MAG: hypothetical protein ABEJ47_00030 [Halorhabdus sp.]
MSRPRLATELRASHGVAAIALFAVLAAVFVTAEFPAPAGFEAGLSVMDGIGYALFDLTGQSGLVTEGFLVSFVLIAVVLDAALDGAVMLAREEDGSVLTTDDDGGEQ